MPMRILEYHRGSTDEQKLTLGAQARTTRAFVESQAFFGWESAGVLVDEGVSTRLPMDQRPGLAEALRRIKAGEADGLVAVKLDRVTRSVAEFDTLLTMANDERRGFRLVLMDVGLDTATATGKLIGRIIAAIAEWERDRISERTKEALAEKAARGEPLGVRTHRVPLVVDGPLRARMVALRASGASTRAIAAQLDAEGVPTVKGGRTWSHSTVADVVRSPG